MGIDSPADIFVQRTGEASRVRSHGGGLRISMLTSSRLRCLLLKYSTHRDARGKDHSCRSQPLGSLNVENQRPQRAICPQSHVIIEALATVV